MSIQINRSGTWQEVSKQEFLDLVSKGVIRPDTEVIIKDQKVVAAKVKGLVFPSDAANAAVPPLQPTTTPTPAAVPVPNQQVDEIPVESLKERVIRQIDKLPRGRKPLAIGGIAILLLLVLGSWLILKPASLSQKEIDRIYAEYGTDLNVKDNKAKHGGTAFHTAVAKENVNVVKFLVSQGADINVKDNAGNLPRSFCASAYRVFSQFPPITRE